MEIHEIKAKISTLATAEDVQRQQRLVNELPVKVMTKQNTEADMLLAYEDLKALTSQYQQRLALEQSLIDANDAETVRKHEQRIAQVTQLKKEHADRFAQYKRDSQRLLDDLKQLISLEQQLGSQMPTPGWNEMHQRELNLPALHNRGEHVGATAQFI